MQTLVAVVKILLGGVVMASAVFVQICILIVLLPSRNLRIRSCNYWGKVTGRILMWLSGCPISVQGWEHLDRDRQAIYACNHTSVFDAFLPLFLSPIGTVGVVKKEIIYYPFFGQMYLLSGHLRIDRTNREAAIRSLQGLAADVERFKLSMWLFPEGTRARDGRLLPLKKGIVHQAIATGLPVVPVVVAGAHKAWASDGLAVRPEPMDIQVLPPISTEGWSKDTIDDHLYEIWDAMRQALPDDQQPVKMMRRLEEQTEDVAA